MNRIPVPRTILLVAAFLAGCSSTQTRYSDNGLTADKASPSPIHVIDAAVEYQGNRDYLPRSLHDSPGNSEITARYSYNVSYSTGKEHELTVFNPLLIAGVSKTEDQISVSGTLELLRDGDTIKQYRESITLTKNKTLYSEGETYTDMRRDGLLHVRDSIDRQIYDDRLFWTDITNSSHQPAATQ